MSISAPLIAALVTGLLLGALLAWLALSRRLAGLQAERARLGAELESERAAHAREREYLEKAQEQLKESFTALSSEALQRNSESFLQLAEPDQIVTTVHPDVTPDPVPPPAPDSGLDYLALLRQERQRLIDQQLDSIHFSQLDPNQKESPSHDRSE